MAALLGEADIRRTAAMSEKCHERATSDASLPCQLNPSTVRKGGVLLAREQRRLAAIATADVVGYSRAAYGQIYRFAA